MQTQQSNQMVITRQPAKTIWGGVKIHGKYANKIR